MQSLESLVQALCEGRQDPMTDESLMLNVVKVWKQRPDFRRRRQNKHELPLWRTPSCRVSWKTLAGQDDLIEQCRLAGPTDLEAIQEKLEMTRNY